MAKKDAASGDLFARLPAPPPAPKPEPPKLEPLESVSAVLAQIAELISDPARWNQRSSGRDESGRPCPSEFASTRSAYGAFALLRIQGRLSNHLAARVWLALDNATPAHPKLGKLAFARWHDLLGTTHEHVLTMLRQAMSQAEEIERATVSVRGGVQ